MIDSANGGFLKAIPVGDIAGASPPPTSGATDGAHEAEQLVNDIRESNGATYYLQPVVVKQRDDNSWKLSTGSSP